METSDYLVVWYSFIEFLNSIRSDQFTMLGWYLSLLRKADRNVNEAIFNL